jgi:hypothetical protein
VGFLDARIDRDAAAAMAYLSEEAWTLYGGEVGVVGLSNPHLESYEVLLRVDLAASTTRFTIRIHEVYTGEPQIWLSTETITVGPGRNRQGQAGDNIVLSSRSDAPSAAARAEEAIRPVLQARLPSSPLGSGMLKSAPARTVTPPSS